MGVTPTTADDYDTLMRKILDATNTETVRGPVIECLCVRVRARIIIAQSSIFFKYAILIGWYSLSMKYNHNSMIINFFSFWIGNIFSSILSACCCYYSFLLDPMKHFIQHSNKLKTQIDTSIMSKSSTY